MVECSRLWVPRVENGNPLLSLELHIVKGLCELLLGMRAFNQCFHACIIQPIFLGYFKVKAPSILEKINVTLWFTRKFMWLDWGFWCPTIAHANSLVIEKFKCFTWHTASHTWCFYTTSLHPWWVIPIKSTFLLYPCSKTHMGNMWHKFKLKRKACH
jgi:hypothetical protein